MFKWILLFMSVSLTSYANVYYVDRQHPKALDSNPGTESLPWKTPYAWINRVVAGDTVLVKAGNYDVTAGGTWSKPALNPKNEGKPDMPITFKAYPGHKVVLNGRLSTIGSNNRDYIIVDGFTVVKGHITVFGGFERVKGVVIRNNTVSDKPCRGRDNCEAVRIEKASNIIARNNRIFNLSNPDQASNASGFKVYSMDHSVIENNEIWNVAQGMYIKRDAVLNHIRYNYIHDVSHIGISVLGHISGDPHKDNRVHGNIVSNSGYQGMYIAGTSPSNQNTMIYNNVVANAKKVAYAFSSQAINAQAWNNISYKSPVSGLNGAKPPFGYCDYNLYFMSSGKCGTHIVLSDPKFVGTSLKRPEDFKLQSISPAKGAGRNGEDIGAYASGSEVIGVW